VEVKQIVGTGRWSKAEDRKVDGMRIAIVESMTDSMFIPHITRVPESNGLLLTRRMKFSPYLRDHQFEGQPCETTSYLLRLAI
jgi:hypothetical protein